MTHQDGTPTSGAELGINLQINLSGIWGRVSTAMQTATHMVAVAEHSAPRIESGWLTVPDAFLQVQFNANMPVTTEQVRSQWRLWALRNAFRDIAETIAETLEEVYAILGTWTLVGSTGRARITIQAWQVLQDSRQAFHQLNLPAKFARLETEHGLVLQPDDQADLLSINAVRNCLVHRGGIVGPKDVDKTPGHVLALTWRMLIPYIHDSQGERPLGPGYVTREDSMASLRPKRQRKEFLLNQSVELGHTEFAGVAWTLVQVAIHLAQALEEAGRVRGFSINTAAAPPPFS